MTTQMAINTTRTTPSSYLALAAPAPLLAQAQVLHGGALLESWEARMAVPILARTTSYLDSAAGEAVLVLAVVVVVVVRFLGLEGEGLPRALGVVRMVHHQCRRLRVGMAKVRVCVADSKVRSGLIDGVVVMVVVDDLVVGAAHGGMDQEVEWAVEVVVTELFTF